MSGRPTQILRPLLHACGALLLALAVLLAVGAPAHAVTRYEITAPTGTVTGPTTITAEVDGEPYEHIDAVELRLLRGDEAYGPVRSLTHTGGTRDPGDTTIWETGLDPMRSWAADDGPMHNGTYRFEIKVITSTPLGQDETPWQGRDVVIDVYPPATAVAAKVLDHDARSIEVSWDASPVPDFRRYVVQRAGEADWTDVATLTKASATRHVDVAPKAGTYRYRVMVVRASGGGGDSPSTSKERSVTVEEPDPASGEPDPDDGAEDDEPATDDPDGAGGDDDASGDGGANAGDDGEQDAAASSGFGRRAGSGAPPTAGGATVPSFETTDTADAPSPRPEVNSPGVDIFEEILPYDYDTETEREVTELHTEVRPGETIEGGTLSVHNRELALEQVLPPLAGGLLLFVAGGHVLRLRRD